MAAGIASFGSVNVGSSSPATDVTLSNIGNAALNLSGIVPSTEFNVSGMHTSCGTSTPLAVGASPILGIEFMPTSPGNQMGSVTLTDDAYNDVTSTQSVALLGTGVALIPSQLVLGTLPATVASGGNLGTVTATVEDASGNTVTSSTAAVTATITGPNGYSQTVTAAAVNGVASLNLRPGSAAGFTLALTPGTAGFSSAITLTATGLPAGATYSFSPATATPGVAPATTVLTVQTTKPVATARNLGAAAGITLALLVLPLGVSRKRREALKATRLLSALGVLLLLGGAAGLSGCGSSNGFFGQPQQSYTVTVTATSGSLVHSTTVVLNLQ